MNKNDSAIPLVLFAKAPVAGQVKTRLISHCSAEQAATIAEILLAESLRKTVGYWPGKVYLSVRQYQQHPFIVSMLEQFGVELLLQTEGDLGQKMQATFDQLGYPMAIMGCDAPLVTPEILTAAHKCLAQAQNVIGPSEDGGYFLIGLSQPQPELFKGISWGSETVFAETSRLASAHGNTLVNLTRCYDVDRWQDVLRASAEISALKDYLVLQKLVPE